MVFIDSSLQSKVAVQGAPPGSDSEAEEAILINYESIMIFLKSL